MLTLITLITLCRNVSDDQELDHALEATVGLKIGVGRLKMMIQCARALRASYRHDHQSHVDHLLQASHELSSELILDDPSNPVNDPELVSQQAQIKQEQHRLLDEAQQVFTTHLAPSLFLIPPPNPIPHLAQREGMGVEGSENLSGDVSSVGLGTNNVVVYQRYFTHQVFSNLFQLCLNHKYIKAKTTSASAQLSLSSSSAVNSVFPSVLDPSEGKNGDTKSSGTGGSTFGGVPSKAGVGVGVGPTEQDGHDDVLITCLRCAYELDAYLLALTTTNPSPAVGSTNISENRRDISLKQVEELLILRSEIRHALYQASQELSEPAPTARSQQTRSTYEKDLAKQRRAALSYRFEYLTTQISFLNDFLLFSDPSTVSISNGLEHKMKEKETEEKALFTKKEIKRYVINGKMVFLSNEGIQKLHTLQFEQNNAAEDLKSASTSTSTFPSTSLSTSTAGSSTSIFNIGPGFGSFGIPQNDESGEKNKEKQAGKRENELERSKFEKNEVNRYSGLPEDEAHKLLRSSVDNLLDSVSSY